MRNEEWQRQTEQITITKQSGVGVKTLHRFYYLILQTPPTKSASDFAAIELANKM